MNFQPESPPAQRGTWYLWIVRALAFCTAPVLWYVSFQFSVKGFVFLLPDYIWIGQVFGVVFTVLELMFNRGVSRHPTLFVAGVFAYVYSISTNALGLFTASDLSTLSGAMSVIAVIVLVICAFGLDILPESMLVWSLYPGEPIITGDFVSSLLSGTKLPSGWGSGQKARPSAVHRTLFPSVRGQGTDTDIRTDEFGQINEPFIRSEADRMRNVSRPTIINTTNQTPTEKAVRAYVYRHMTPDKTFPSVRDVAHALGKDKSTVGEIMKKMRTELFL